MEVVDCLFKALGIGYVLWMLSFLFLEPQRKAETAAQAVRPWWLDYTHADDISDIAMPVVSALDRRN